MFLAKLLMLNPIQFIANTTIKFLIKRFNVNQVAFSLINILYHAAKSLVGSVDIFPTIRILRDVRKFLTTFEGRPTAAHFELRNFLSARHNPYLVETICHKLIPVISLCFPKTSGMLFIYDFFLVGFFTTILKPITKYLVKTSLGLVLSATGILWNETLSSISYLKDFSLYIIETLESHSSFRIPRFNNEIITDNVPARGPTVDTHTTPVHNVPVDFTDMDPDIQNTGALFSFLGVLLIGVVTVISVIVIADHLAPDTIQNIPVINTISNSVHVGFNGIYDTIANLFSGGPGTPPGTGDNINGPRVEVISRSSSGGSDITITDNRAPITPPTSRPATPYPVNNNEWA